MNILSYRGPATAGGVSSALARIIEGSSGANRRWWYVNGADVESRTGAIMVPQVVGDMPKSVIDGHYSYCNSFIWPVLHDLPEYASFSPRDRRHYRRFNHSFANHILRSRLFETDTCFVNDYQLAPATSLIAQSHAMDILLFWHVPWPSHVRKEHAPYLAEIARGLLGANRIGFHTEEYVSNFLAFVGEHLPDYRTDTEGGIIIGGANGQSRTELVALPLGLDFRFWRETAADASPVHKDVDLRNLVSGRFVLSVDRADYTKGVLERLEAIDTFFAANPQRLGEITFVQVCQPSRMGLPAFDKYWLKCRERGAQLNQRWQNGSWQPLAWIDKPVPPRSLAWLYSRADAMLVNPVRDGLNLTAKEFAVCSNNGALILSRGAGVWHELGDKTVPLANLNAEEIAAKIEASLSMPLEDKVQRLKEMKQKIAANSLRLWWRKFEKGTKDTGKVVPLSARAQASGTETRKGLLLAR